MAPDATALLVPSVVNTAELSRLDAPRLAYAGFLARYRANTLSTYKVHLDGWLRWLAEHGVDDPLTVQRPHVELWLRALEQQGLKSATRSQKFGVVSLFYKYAVIDGLLTANPCQHVDRPRILEREQRRTWLPLIDYLVLLDTAIKTGPREHLFVALLGEVALRVGEACSLNVTDVGRNQGWRTITFRGKGGDLYEEVIPPQVVADLDRVIDGRQIGPLLLNRDGQRMNRRSAERLLARLTRRAGITRDITPHGLRRAAATNMLAQGVPLRDVQIKLRHKDPRMTMRYDQGQHSLDRSASLRYASSLYGMLNTG